MTERIRINKIQLAQTVSGKHVAHLHAPGAQYAKYPALYLFDIGLLTSVGVDPNSLSDEPVHVNVWANYELSEKLNARGNPYKNVVSLEAIDAPATTTSVDTSAILGELRAIKTILQHIATLPPLPAGPVQVAQAARIQKLNNVRDHTAASFDDVYMDEDGYRRPPGYTSDTPQATSDQEPELPEAEARTEFYAQAAPAIAKSQVDPQAVNDLTRVANGDGWNAALTGLKKLLASN